MRKDDGGIKIQAYRDLFRCQLSDSDIHDGNLGSE
jgi:hypothetical protein